MDLFRVATRKRSKTFTFVCMHRCRRSHSIQLRLKLAIMLSHATHSMFSSSFRAMDGCAMSTQCGCRLTFQLSNYELFRDPKNDCYLR